MIAIFSQNCVQHATFQLRTMRCKPVHGPGPTAANSMSTPSFTRRCHIESPGSSAEYCDIHSCFCSSSHQRTLLLRSLHCNVHLQDRACSTSALQVYQATTERRGCHFGRVRSYAPRLHYLHGRRSMNQPIRAVQPRGRARQMVPRKRSERLVQPRSSSKLKVPLQKFHLFCNGGYMANHKVRAVRPDVPARATIDRHPPERVRCSARGERP